MHDEPDRDAARRLDRHGEPDRDAKRRYEEPVERRLDRRNASQVSS
jgi:hypothetical protein